MKRRPITVAVLLIVTVFILPLFARGSQSPMDEKPAYTNNFIKIKLSSDAARRSQLPTALYAESSAFGINELDQLLSVRGGTSIIRAHRKVKDQAWADKTGWDNWFLIRLDGRSSVEEAIASFKQNRYVEEAVPEYLAYTTAVPNDTYYPNHWGHNNTAQLPGYTASGHTGSGVGTPGWDADAQLAWDLPQGYGDPNIIIAIIDSGVDTAHEDLRLVTGYDYGSNDSNPMDDAPEAGHGTCCSGIAAGIANNNLGVAGIAGGCSVMPLKIADNNGDMMFTYIENAITHAADNGAHVISMSLGAPVDEGYSSSTDSALAYAYNYGVIIFAATANANASTIEYPANSQYVVSVGAASPSGERKSPSSSDGEDWWGSNYGVNTQDARNAVDIMAPTILPATDISGSGGYQSGNYYLYFNGTSCATPYAAGVAALVLSADPSLSPAELRSILTSTATDMTIDGGTGWDRYTGYGMVNAYAALMALDPSLPDVSITAPANGSVLDLGDQINVTATASDGDGSITSVAFYLDDVLQFTDYSSPYQWTWDTSTSSAGNHRIKAIATDNDSNTFFSSILVSLVVPADEGFESGNFSAYPWINSSTSPWTVQNTDKYSGNYAAKSGTISNNAQTELSVTHYVNQAGNISFWYKVSSELNYDKLYFLIDGVEKNNWSGSINWTQVSYPVSVGTHTFTWRYSKDGSEFSGSDCAWIDHIIFPPLGAYYAPATNLSAIPADGSITLNWSSPGGSVQAFKVYRDDTLITTTSNTTFTDNSVSNGNSYSYYVIAVYAGGESEATTTITVVAGQVLEAILGSGTSTTGYSNASPINTYYRSLHGQSVYTKAELHSAGISGPINITQIGFDVVTLPNLALPSFIVRMKHTSDTDVTNWQSADDMQTVYGPLTYAPATGWDMLTLSTPFLWNGTDNIVIDTAFDRVAEFSSSGTVHYSTVTNGYRYARSDGSNQTDVFSGGYTATTRPNLKLIFSPLSEDPEIVVSTSSLDFGNIRIYDTASQSFTISNSGGGTLEGSIACSGVFSVAEISGKKGLNRSSREVSRNTITYSIGEGSSKSFRVTFDPVTTGETTGTITITHNSDGADKSISLAGEAYNPVPDTPVPTNAATNVNPNQVLSWTNDGTVTAVDVYVGTSEYNLIKVADQQSDPLNSYTSPTAWTYQTTYYWKVVAHNSSIYSGESAVFSFTTIADPTLTPPFTEEFGSFPPTNWTRFSGALAENSSLSSTTSGWVADGFANVGSTGSAKINVYGENRYYWLVSPSINLDAGKANYQLSFDLALTEWNATTGPETDGTDDKFAVVISTDDGATWSSSNTLALWDNVGASSVYNNISYTGENIVVPLSSYSGSVKIAFYAESSSSNADNDLFVDNVSVSAIPVSPIFSVSPGSKDFGTLLVGQNMQQDFVISNMGTGSLGITEVALQNSDTCFSLTDVNSYPASLDYGDQLIVSISFTPTTAGSFSATLVVNDDQTGKSAHQVQISGAAYQPLTVPFVEAFESSASDWHIVNGSETNAWYIGDAVASSGTNSIYISNDAGDSNNYDISAASVTHFYSDITFPESSEDFYLRFNWLANGESNSYSNYDYLQVYLIDIDVMPEAGSQLESGSGLDDVLLGAETWQNLSVQLPEGLAGLTKRLVFTWRNDGSMGNQPPAAIDNIRIVAVEDQDVAVVIGGETEIELPPVTDPDSNVISSTLTIDGVLGAQVHFTVGYNSVGSGFANAGLDITLSADGFDDPYLIIDHNLGFIPSTIAYSLGGSWIVIANPGSWTESSVDLSISTGKKNAAKASNLTIVFSNSADDTLPVTLSSFTAVYTASSYVRLDWMTASETGVMGYYILRSSSPQLAEAQIISPLIDAVNTADGACYSFQDRDLTQPGTYYYWLNNQDFNGAEGFYGPLSVNIQSIGDNSYPVVPALTQSLGNYPNPFNPETHLRYSLAEAADVSVKIFNSRGQLVKSMVQRHNSPGYYSILWEGKDDSGREQSSGVYFYRIQIGDYSNTQRMLLLK